MNSHELNNLGQWRKWTQSVVWEAPLSSGIYVFRLADGKTIQRLRGDSDILYVGCSTKLRKRLKDHRRVMDVERNIAYRLQRVEQEIGQLEVSWESYDNGDKAEDAERLLLAKYEADHIEFPPIDWSHARSGGWLRNGLSWRPARRKISWVHWRRFAPVKQTPVKIKLDEIPPTRLAVLSSVDRLSQ